MFCKHLFCFETKRMIIFASIFLFIFYFFTSFSVAKGPGWAYVMNRKKENACLFFDTRTFHQRKLWILINVICSAPPNTNVVWASPNGVSAMPLPMWLIKFPVQSFFWVYCLLRRHTHFLWTFLSDKYGAKVRNMGHSHFNEMKYFNRGIKNIYQ